MSCSCLYVKLAPLAHTCRGHKRMSSVLIYPFLSYSCDTRSFTLPRSRLASRKHQLSSCLPLPQCWSYSRVHTQLFMSVLEILTQALMFAQKVLLSKEPLPHPFLIILLTFIELFVFYYCVICIFKYNLESHSCSLVILVSYFCL